MEAVPNPSPKKGNFCLSCMAITPRQIQKHKNRCQDMDHCTFISRVSALSLVILRTTLHWLNLSTMIKSKSAKSQRKHHCKQTLIIYQTRVSNNYIVKLVFNHNMFHNLFWLQGSKILKNVLLFYWLFYSFIISYRWLVWYWHS